jgi:hypothetical protein
MLAAAAAGVGFGLCVSRAWSVLGVDVRVQDRVSDRFGYACDGAARDGSDGGMAGDP